MLEGMGVVEGSPAFLLLCCRHTDTFGDAGTEFHRARTLLRCTLRCHWARTVPRCGLEMSLGQNCAEVCLEMSLDQNCGRTVPWNIS